MKDGDAGYTLTEMLIVIGIIGLLAAVLTPALFGQMARARVKAARLQLENVYTTLETYRSDVGGYPSLEEGLDALIIQPEAAEGWLGPYVRDRKALQDPWGHAIVYRPDGVGGAPKVVSLGADGKIGGKGVDGDISAP